MATQKRFQTLVAELDDLNAQLQLQLPTNNRALASQLRQLTEAQQRLEEIGEEVDEFCQERRDTEPYSGVCQTLAQLAEAVRLKAMNFCLLAEEFSADPEGTTACLHSMGDRNQTLMSQIGRLKTAPMPWWWSIV